MCVSLKVWSTALHRYMAVSGATANLIGPLVQNVKVVTQYFKGSSRNVEMGDGIHKCQSLM